MFGFLTSLPVRGDPALFPPTIAARWVIAAIGVAGGAIKSVTYDPTKASISFAKMLSFAKIG
jgi:hypothetical protein